MLQEKDSDVRNGSIDELVGRFRRHAAAICAEAADPDLCADMAMHWNGSFVDWLSRHGVDADLMVCEGDGGDPVSWHVVVRIGTVAVDWAGRLIDRTCAVPHVAAISDTMARWDRVTEFCLYEAIQEQGRMEPMLELKAA